jgi:hypothetical protein
MSGINLQIAAPLTTTIDLLAQGAVDNLGGGFRGNRATPDWITFVLVVAVVVAAIGVVWLVSRHLSLKEAGKYHNHRGLFRELCRAHRLCWSDQRLLLVVARQQGVAVPARLFLEPDRFDPERLENLKVVQRNRVAELHETLFRADTGAEH